MNEGDGNAPALAPQTLQQGTTMSGDAPAPAAPASTADTGGSIDTGSSGSAPAESSAPKTTADIATNVIERAANPPEPEGADDDLMPTDPRAIERWTEEERLLREFGFKRAKKADGSEQMVPRSKVLSMIASGLKRGTEKWGQERTQIEQEAAQLRQFRDGFAESLRGDPDAFLAYVAQHDPRYRRYLEQEQQRQAQPAQPPHSDEPQPDVDLGNGARTFSPQGLRKWLDWAVEQRLDQRIAPLAKAHEDQQRQAAVERAQQEIHQRVTQQLEHAKGWPNWGDYEGDVLQKLQQDSAAAQKAGQRPRMTLREAFLEVRADRLEASADPAKVRQQVIQDINSAPRSTALRSSTEVPRQPGVRSTADFARAAIERGDRSR